MGKKIVIIGGIATGPKAAARIKRLDPEADVTILEQDRIISFGACGLPYFIGGEVQSSEALMSTPAGVMRNEAFFKNVKGVTVLTGMHVHSIDRPAKIVRAVHPESTEERAFPYDKLVLAMGAQALVPALPGVALRNIHRVRRLSDALAIGQRLEEVSGGKAVIVGGSLIGMEMAEALHNRGMKVTVVEMRDWLFPAILDRDMGLIVQRYVRERGIEVITSEPVRRFEGNAEGDVISVVTDKREIEADVVVLALGVSPNGQLACDAGLDVNANGAIRVNAFLQTSDPDIYAGGDCVENPHLLAAKMVFTPMGSVANKHGRIIADHICGRTAPFAGVLGTAICRVMGFNVGRTGFSAQEAELQGRAVETILCAGDDRPHYFPGSGKVIVKLIVEKESRKVVGAQAVGPGDVAKRIDVLVTALSLGATVDQLAGLDLAYAPPFAPAMDPVITAANVMQNKLAGLAKGISPLLVKERMERDEDFILLDVRGPAEHAEVRIDHPKVRLLPLGKLRSECENLPKDKEIIAFCRVSLRGYEAQRILEAQGYRNVKFMEGGLVAWPYETVGTLWG